MDRFIIGNASLLQYLSVCRIPCVDSDVERRRKFIFLREFAAYTSECECWCNFEIKRSKGQRRWKRKHKIVVVAHFRPSVCPSVCVNWGAVEWWHDNLCHKKHWDNSEVKRSNKARGHWDRKCNKNIFVHIYVKNWSINNTKVICSFLLIHFFTSGNA